MKEVKKCSISGVAFTLDIDAYETLAAYIESLKKSYKNTDEGAEIVADIEARIAELILSAQDSARVVEKPLILNIIQQLGSAEDISGDSDSDLKDETPRIPRRLFRDTEHAKLGGVCAGIGRYFDVDPVWIRLGMFLPVLLTCLNWLPFMGWAAAMMGNLFAILVICYLIMWFAVPAARSARQKLEMTGERITAQSIHETTTASNDPDSRAKPIIAEAISVFGKIVLIMLKIIAGLIVFGLIMCACALLIGLMFVIAGGEGLFTPEILGTMVSPWVASLGIITALIPAILLIYVMMCLIASRKPGGKAVLAIFLLWLASIIALCTMAIRENVGEKIRDKKDKLERIMESEIIIDGDSTTLQRLIEQLDDSSIVEEDNKSVRINIPSKQVDITVDKQANEANIEIKADGSKVTLHASQDADDGTVSATSQPGK